jgi:diguanylate cyclase (GGDEF)-like protein
MTVHHEEESSGAFWRSHANVGAALSAAVLIQVVLYGWLADNVASPGTLYLVAVSGGVVTTGAWLLAPSAIRRSWSQLFFFCWSLGAAALILTALSGDGGDQSPLTALLFLPLLYAALAYAPPAVLVLGVLETLGYVVMAARDSSPSTAYTCVLASTILLATAMAALCARNRERRVRQMAVLTQRLHDQATHDPLTGLFNRRGFDIGLDRELARVTRHRRPLSLLLVDVDCLKAINDTAGHAAGDAALCTVADSLAAVARRTDIVARLGGDEFAILTPESNAREAAVVAARLHAEVEARAAATGLTVSIGLASFDASRAQSEFLLAADIALYQAKRAGRNCTRGKMPVPRSRSGDGSSSSRKRSKVPAS